MRLRAEGAGQHHHREHRQVSAKHRPGGEEDHHPPQQREVGVPRLSEGAASVPAGEQSEEGGHAHDEPRPRPPRRDGQRRDDGGYVDEERPDLQRPRRRTQQAVGRGEGVEAQRTGVAALAIEGPDAAREPDERRVTTADVPHTELGHREVEDRGPHRSTEADQRDQQGQAHEGGGARHQQPG